MSHGRQVEQIMQTLPTMSRLCAEGHDPDVFRSVLQRIGDKWSLLLIGILTERPHRFTELLRTVPGVSRRMLTVTLRALQRDGLVDRTVFAEVPPRVEYEVTELVRSLGSLARDIADWAATHQDEIVTHREAFDRAANEAGPSSANDGR